MRAGAIVRHDAPAALRASSTSETVVRIRLAAPLASAAQALAPFPGVTLLAGPSQPATEVAYRTPDPDSVNPAVIARLVTDGARIVSVACETRALEDIYAEAVGWSGQRQAVTRRDRGMIAQPGGFAMSMTPPATALAPSRPPATRASCC